MPSFRPRTSCAPLADLSQTPACIFAFFSGSRRAIEMISAIASSTTLRVLENGALNTGDAALGRRGEVDLVRADAERADGEQVRGGREDPLGDVRLRSDAEQTDALERLDELFLAERAWHRAHFVAGLRQSRRRVRMNVLQQQRAVERVQRQHLSPSDGIDHRP